MGANGAILITSRKYYNFMRDDERKGDTVKPFDPRQSFDLLCQFLGEDMRDLQQKRLLKLSEVNAAKEFLGRLEGLALAIQQAAILIKNEDIGGPTIETTFDLFKQHAKSLPERQAGGRSETYHSLDTLWDMNFRLLHKDARQLLSVLSLLSPGIWEYDLHNSLYSNLPRYHLYRALSPAPSSGRFPFLSLISISNQALNILGAQWQTFVLQTTPKPNQ